jgi:hypothetical protein
MRQQTFIPVHLNRWENPSHYVGAQWPHYYSFLGRSRDSDALERANFGAGLKAIGGESTQDFSLLNDPDHVLPVRIVRENHWAVGWVEWIAIHESATEALEIADKIKGELVDYPVVDETLWSEYEDEEAQTVWRDCFRVKERVAYVREHRSQFEFQDFADMLGCVRGKYFAGYASELIS